ncbi:unnamed protein product [Amoebophrya sp. A120]|nr:unnamed protein product [Amoebophrya sp. A120]|eukprot:GSA120T00000905001.1
MGIDGIRFEEVRDILEKKHYACRNIAGSHHIFRKPGYASIPVPVHNGKVSFVMCRVVARLVRNHQAQQLTRGFLVPEEEIATVVGPPLQINQTSVSRCAERKIARQAAARREETSSVVLADEPEWEQWEMQAQRSSEKMDAQKRELRIMLDDLASGEPTLEQLRDFLDSGEGAAAFVHFPDEMHDLQFVLVEMYQDRLGESASDSETTRNTLSAALTRIDKWTRAHWRNNNELQQAREEVVSFVVDKLLDRVEEVEHQSSSFANLLADLMHVAQHASLFKMLRNNLRFCKLVVRLAPHFEQEVTHLCCATSSKPDPSCAAAPETSSTPTVTDELSNFAKAAVWARMLHDLNPLSVLRKHAEGNSEDDKFISDENFAHWEFITEPLLQLFRYMPDFAATLQAGSSFYACAFHPMTVSTTTSAGARQSLDIPLFQQFLTKFQEILDTIALNEFVKRESSFIQFLIARASHEIHFAIERSHPPVSAPAEFLAATGGQLAPLDYCRLFSSLEDMKQRIEMLHQVNAVVLRTAQVYAILDNCVFRPTESLPVAADCDQQTSSADGKNEKIEPAMKKLDDWLLCRFVNFGCHVLLQSLLMSLSVFAATSSTGAAAILNPWLTDTRKTVVSVDDASAELNILVLCELFDRTAAAARQPRQDTVLGDTLAPLNRLRQLLAAGNVLWLPGYGAMDVCEILHGLSPAAAEAIQGANTAQVATSEFTQENDLNAVKGFMVALWCGVRIGQIVQVLKPLDLSVSLARYGLPQKRELLLHPPRQKVGDPRDKSVLVLASLLLQLSQLPSDTFDAAKLRSELQEGIDKNEKTKCQDFVDRLLSCLPEFLQIEKPPLERMCAVISQCYYDAERLPQSACVWALAKDATIFAVTSDVLAWEPLSRISAEVQKNGFVLPAPIQQIRPAASADQPPAVEVFYPDDRTQTSLNTTSASYGISSALLDDTTFVTAGRALTTASEPGRDELFEAIRDFFKIFKKWKRLLSQRVFTNDVAAKTGSAAGLSEQHQELAKTFLSKARKLLEAQVSLQQKERVAGHNRADNSHRTDLDLINEQDVEGVGLVFDGEVLSDGSAELALVSAHGDASPSFSRRYHQYVEHTLTKNVFHNLAPQPEVLLDILAVAALVSWRQTLSLRRETRKLRRRSPNLFEVTKGSSGASPSIESSFTPCSQFRSSEEKTNWFWKLERADTIAAPMILLAFTLEAARRQGAQFHYKGKRITNVMFLEGFCPVEGLTTAELLCDGHRMSLYPSEAKKKKCVAISTGAAQGSRKEKPHKKSRKAKNKPRAVDAAAPTQQLATTGQQAAGAQSSPAVQDDEVRLEVLREQGMRYFWAAFALDDGTVAHVDLSGPVHDKFEYHLVPGSVGFAKAPAAASKSTAASTNSECESLRDDDPLPVSPRPLANDETGTFGRLADSAAGLEGDWAPVYTFPMPSLALIETSTPAAGAADTRRCVMKSTTNDFRVFKRATASKRAQQFGPLEWLEVSGAIEVTLLPDFLNAVTKGVRQSSDVVVIKSVADECAIELVGRSLVSALSAPTVSQLRAKVDKAPGLKKQYSGQGGCVLRPAESKALPAEAHVPHFARLAAHQDQDRSSSLAWYLYSSQMVPQSLSFQLLMGKTKNVVQFPLRCLQLLRKDGTAYGPQWSSADGMRAAEKRSLAAKYGKDDIVRIIDKTHPWFKYPGRILQITREAAMSGHVVVQLKIDDEVDEIVHLSPRKLELVLRGRRKTFEESRQAVSNLLTTEECEQLNDWVKASVPYLSFLRMTDPTVRKGFILAVNNFETVFGHNELMLACTDKFKTLLSMAQDPDYDKTFRHLISSTMTSPGPELHQLASSPKYRTWVRWLRGAGGYIMPRGKTNSEQDQKDAAKLWNDVYETRFCLYEGSYDSAQDFYNKWNRVVYGLDCESAFGAIILRSDASDASEDEDMDDDPEPHYLALPPSEAHYAIVKKWVSGKNGFDPQWPASTLEQKLLQSFGAQHFFDSGTADLLQMCEEAEADPSCSWRSHCWSLCLFFSIVSFLHDNPNNLCTSAVGLNKAELGNPAGNNFLDLHSFNPEASRKVAAFVKQYLPFIRNKFPDHMWHLSPFHYRHWDAELFAELCNGALDYHLCYDAQDRDGAVAKVRDRVRRIGSTLLQKGGVLLMQLYLSVLRFCCGGMYNVQEEAEFSMRPVYPRDHDLGFGADVSADQVVKFCHCDNIHTPFGVTSWVAIVESMWHGIGPWRNKNPRDWWSSEPPPTSLADCHALLAELQRQNCFST